MPSWKKVITSGSNAVLNQITASGDVTIDSKLGIGTTSPADSIDIQQTDSVIRFKNTGASNWEGIELYNPSDSSFVAGFGSYANTSNGYIRDSGGNIAIFNSSTWTFNRVVRMSDGSSKYGFHHQNNTYRTGFGGILGSAAQATIHISGSGNNIGLYSEGFISGSSTSTGSFGAGYIDNKLGIGTTSPDEGLHLKSKNILFERAGYDTGDQIKWKVGGNDRFTLRFDTTAGGLLFFNEHGGVGNHLFLDRLEAHVGIGTTTPTSELTVQGDISASGDFLGSSTSTGSFGKLRVNNTGYGGMIEWGDTYKARLYNPSDDLTTYLYSARDMKIRGHTFKITDSSETDKLHLMISGQPKIFSTTGSFQVLAGTTSVADGGAKDSGGGFGFLTYGSSHTHIFATAYRPGGNTGNYGVQFHNSYANKATGSLLIKDSAKIDLLTLDGAIVSGSATSTGSFGRIQATTIGGNSPLNIESPTLVGDTTVQGSLTATHDIIAQRYIVNSSVTNMTQSFSSGSTIFGDSTDDTHQFTGSLNLSGSLTVEGASTTTSGDANAGITLKAGGEKILQGWNEGNVNIGNGTFTTAYKIMLHGKTKVQNADIIVDQNKKYGWGNETVYLAGSEAR